MAAPGITAIRIRRGEHVFHVHGDKAGQEGIWLAKGQVSGIYEAPVKTTYKTGAFQRGSTAKATKWLHRDLELGFHCKETVSNTYEWNESAFRQIFAFEDDQWSLTPKKTTIEVVTDISGTRKLDVLMYEEPEFTSETDPLKQQYGNLLLKLRAAQPLWYEDDYTDEFTSTATTAAGTVTVHNPTDQIMYHRWVLTSAATSGDVTWKLPDFQWVGDPGEREPGGDNATRLIDGIVLTQDNDGCIIETDRSQLMYRDSNDTNLLGQMGANKIFNYPIPPYTHEYSLPVSYKGATGGATAQLVMPRRWSRPWGLEPTTVLNTASPQDNTFHITTPGSFEYEIPHWCERMDIVVIGGGGGGEGGGLAETGAGGNPAAFTYSTVIRGVDIPWATTHIKGVVGAGGRGGRGVQFLAWGDFFGGIDGEDGNPSYAVASGMTTIHSDGGVGGKLGFVTGDGVDDLEFNTKTYTGSADQKIISDPGNSPGGGGAGGWMLVGRGGDGGDGQVSIRAYGWSGS